jgi:hypothetical protein
MMEENTHKSFDLRTDPCRYGGIFPGLCAGHERGHRHLGLDGLRPLTLAKEAGIFKKNGLDVSLKKVPRASRHFAIQSGDIQCAANPKPGRSAPGTEPK